MQCLEVEIEQISQNIFCTNYHMVKIMIMLNEYEWRIYIFRSRHSFLETS